MSAQEDLAYAAGIIDGEGCFSLQKSGGTYRTTIQVSMTNKEVPQWLHKQFSGHFGPIAATESTEELFLWVLASKPIIAKLIPDLLPYLRVKRIQATLLLEFCRKFNVGKAGRYTPANFAEMETYHRIMMLANSKGPGSTEVKQRLFKVLTGELNA